MPGESLSSVAGPGAPSAVTRGTWWAASACAAVALVLGVQQAMQVGIAWAENDYLAHAELIRWWWDGLFTGESSPASGERYRVTWEDLWAFNPHPPLYKYAAVLFRALLPGLAFPLAERLPTALVFAVATWAMCVMVGRHHGAWAALGTGMALVGMPRVVGHAGFLTTDTWLSAGWVLVPLLFERARSTGGRRWWLALWVTWAAALGVKMSALAMGAPLFVLSAWWSRREGPAGMLRHAVRITAVGVATVPVLVLLSPWLWAAPVERLVNWVVITATWARQQQMTALHHGHIMLESALPWTWAPEMVALVTPVPVLVLAAWGVLEPRHRASRAWQAVVACAAFWVGMAITGRVPRYDNERQLLPLLWLLAPLAGMGLASATERAAAALRTVPAVATRAVLTGACAAVLALDLLVCWPLTLSYFSPVVGGLEGATARGHEPTYLMEALTPATLAELQVHIPRGAGVTVLPATGMAAFFHRRGLLREDLQVDGFGPWFIMVNRHLTALGDGAQVRRNGQMVWQRGMEGVPLVELWHAEGLQPVKTR